MSLDFEDLQCLCAKINNVEKALKEALRYEKSEEKFIRDYLIANACEHLLISGAIKAAKHYYLQLKEDREKANPQEA